MSTSANPSDVQPDVTTAVRALMPDLHRHTRQAWILIGLVAVLVLIFGYNLLGVGEGPTFLFPVLIGGVLIALIVRWTRKSHEKAIMPILASTVGFSYDKNATGFAKALPNRLLPDGIRAGEDFLTGRIGGRIILMAEVKVETGGKNSRTLFKGVVANFPNAVPMPPFFIAPEGQTGRSFWFGNRLDVEGLVQIRAVTGMAGRRFGVWASSTAVADNPALSAVVEILTELEQRVSGEAQLFSATSNGEEMHVALTHKRDLYKMGGLFLNQTTILDEVQAAYRDLTIPLTIAGRLMEAEKKAEEDVKKE